MSTRVRWTLGILLALLVTVVPVVRFRWVYTHSKRLREVTPGVLYRSGEMTAPGFRETVARFHIRTIVNLQDEWPDPDLYTGYFTLQTIPETELCKELGVRYVYIPPDLIPRHLVPGQRPVAIEHFLALLDDESNFPILVHCRAGLHRTGIMTAVYHMEHDGWDSHAAIEDLKANGFGEYPCTSANDYITQYILTYQRGVRRSPTIAQRP
jgi:protein-tyrosine phosphatase